MQPSTTPPKYGSRIARALDRAYDACITKERVIDQDLDGARLVFFSDHHRGARDGADDFLQCEATYLAALHYYHALDTTLILLGDVEELWECMPISVVNAYANVLALEGEFQKRGCLVKLAGNHDDFWTLPGVVQLHVRKFFGKRMRVHENLIIRFLHDSREIGRAFLGHGHQGSQDGDRFRWINRFLVRYVWRTIQRLTGMKLTTPAKDARLRDDHDRAMYEWANSRSAISPLILIAGHTHLPVFESRTQSERVSTQIASLREELAKMNDKMSVDAGRLVGVIARLEEKLAKLRVEDQAEERSASPNRPCYFNAGCCSFNDGDITGIEVFAGEIRLVRWKNKNGSMERQVLESARLNEEVFAKLRSEEKHGS